ncbi:MAG: UDP-N-acetylglucosamine 2-epimerase (non-hydrolyzing) [Chloroflexi bacterium]|nr:UDP-N-acetylglucosamine 2-epimerase (non-hydrolyzing) [Chloroflexota bacterium]
MKIAVIVGTRPEIIKMAPVVRELENNRVNYFILHTGQHYSYNLDRVFFEQLRLQDAKYNLEVGSGSHAEQTGKILIGVEKILEVEKPDIVLVEGDTNSVLAGALTAVKLHISVGHVEAGLRSYDKQMPEEINRILTDHCSDYLFAPTSKAGEILLGEGIVEEKIFVTGNTIVDAVYQNREIARETGDFLNTLHLTPSEYFLVTLHRQENVDDRARFAPILEGLDRVASEFGLPVIYPIHPRSQKMMAKFGLKPQNIKLIEPTDFLGFLQLESNARLILSDSGGVQEEACILRVPCVTLRDNTERPETIDVGANILAGASSDKILDCVKVMLGRENNWINPFGDGKAGEKIVKVLESVV